VEAALLEEVPRERACRRVGRAALDVRPGGAGQRVQPGEVAFDHELGIADARDLERAAGEAATIAGRDQGTEAVAQAAHRPRRCGPLAVTLTQVAQRRRARHVDHRAR
jgi:hypothetical protein